MKIVGVCASPRQGKTSFQAMKVCLEAAQAAGMETVLIELAGKKINACLACGKCVKELNCSQDDDFNQLIPTLADPELGGLILASPVYLSGMTAQAKAFLDRMVMFRRNGFLLQNKVGGAIAVGGFRNGGQELVIQAIHAGLLAQDMVVVSEGKPTSHLGATCVGSPQGELAGDEFGLKIAASLGRRVAEVAAKLNG